MWVVRPGGSENEAEVQPRWKKNVEPRTRWTDGSNKKARVLEVFKLEPGKKIGLNRDSAQGESKTGDL